MEKRNLYRPQQDAQIQTARYSMEDRGRRPGGSGGDELKLYDSYRPAQGSSKRQHRSISPEIGSLLKHGDSYRPGPYISGRAPRLRDANPKVSEKNSYKRRYDSYRPARDGRDRLFSEESTDGRRRTGGTIREGRVDIYRPASSNTNAAPNNC